MAILFDPLLLPELREEIVMQLEIDSLIALSIVDKAWALHTRKRRELMKSIIHAVRAQAVLTHQMSVLTMVINLPFYAYSFTLSHFSK